MSIPPEYILAKMEAEKSRAQAKEAGAPSGKRYYTPSRDRNAPSAPMIGSPMATPPEYIFAKMEAKKSHAHYAPRAAARERPSSTHEQSISSGSSESRRSADTVSSYEKPAVAGRRSLGLRVREYLH